MLEVGTQAPDFSLKDQNDTKHSLSEYQGRWVVLYFYPKDDTPGCTKEACGFRDSYKTFTDNKITVFGVSKDDVTSHKKFADKFELPFSLLADTNGEVCKNYDALAVKKMFGKEFVGIKRITYLINPEGEIAQAYPKVKPEQHAKEILEFIASQ